MKNSEPAKHVSRIATVKVTDERCGEAKITCLNLDELEVTTSAFDIAGIDYSIDYSEPKPH